MSLAERTLVPNAADEVPVFLLAVALAPEQGFVSLMRRRLLFPDRAARPLTRARPSLVRSR
jgi:hypothetical protein